MTTARALIASSLRLIQVLASNQPMAAAEAADGLACLNQLLDSWSNERLIVYSIVRADVPLIPGQARYTWGLPGGMIAQPRPLQVESAVLSLTGQDLEWPLTPTSQIEYEAIAQKGMSSLYPQYWQYTPDYPLGTLRFWPVPLEAHTAGLFPWVPLRRCASLETVLEFPPGYERLLRFGLAADLSPEYGKEIVPSIAAVLAEAKSAVKRTNTVVPTLGIDPAMRGRRAHGGWIWQTGDYLGRR